MCKCYYIVFPCGHGIKSGLSNCYPSFTCKYPERVEEKPPAEMNCSRCTQVPASKSDVHEVSRYYILRMKKGSLLLTTCLPDPESKCLVKGTVNLGEEHRQRIPASDKDGAE